MGVRLIINADDFGLTKSINRAIIDVYKAGNLTSTTLMVNMPGTDDAVKLALENPKLGVGLHFCITEGKPLTACSTICNKNGNFISRPELIQGIMTAKIDYQEIRKEFKAQLDKFISFGLQPTHCDSHQHTMMFPQIFKAIKPILEDFNLPVRKVNPPNKIVSQTKAKPAKLLRQTMNKVFARKMQALYLNKTNDYLVSVHDLLNVDQINAEAYTNMLSYFSDQMIIELMIHPYITDDEVIKLYASKMPNKKVFLDKCEKEYQILSDAPLFSNFELCTYKILH